ncbi:MAG: hypothetical protein ACRDH9_09275 [Actinomycetota bacterium]
MSDLALNDEMYAWRADTQKAIDGQEADGWELAFASRVVWLVNELERVVTLKQEAGVDG